MSAERRSLCVALTAALLWWQGCAQREPVEVELEASDWVEQIRSTHAAADEALTSSEPELALSLLRSAVRAPVPGDVRPEHRRVVHQDLWFRIARLELGAGRPRDALASTERGLLLGRLADLFVANLLIARGEALEAEGRDTEAAASYYEALEINRGLLGRALAEPDAGAP